MSTDNSDQPLQDKWAPYQLPKNKYGQFVLGDPGGSRMPTTYYYMSPEEMDLLRRRIARLETEVEDLRMKLKDDS
jgi:hypothetical protein